MCVCLVYPSLTKTREQTNERATQNGKRARRLNTLFKTHSRRAEGKSATTTRGSASVKAPRTRKKSVHFNGVCGFREDVPYTQLTAAPPRGHLLGQNKYGWAAAAHTAFR